ncbi:MAG: fibronectin type III-like domain-contianing protein [Acidobacteriia bacterium]|nr:fibronectin type III-like domain-contianing protein [Terriglobia bacterium]
MRARFALIPFTAGAAALAVAVLCAQPQPQPQYPFQDPKLPIQQRVDNIISLMTLDEKIAEDLAYWDEKQNRWVVEADHVKFMAGASSADTKLERTISVGQ